MRSVASVRKTRRSFTVAWMCSDPAVPIEYWNTNSEQQARRLFALIKDQQHPTPLHEWDRRPASGEWELRLWRHTDQTAQPRVLVKTIADPIVDEIWTDAQTPYVYWLDYPGSELLASTSYNDTSTEDA